MTDEKKLNSNQKAIVNKLEEMAKEMREEGFTCALFGEKESIIFFANKNHGEITFQLNDGIYVKAKLY